MNKLPDWLTSNPGDVQGVVKTTERDETGILYSVSVSLRSLAQHSYEEGEDRRGVWQKYIEFGGPGPGHHGSGGAAFTRAAREQEEISDAISALVWHGEQSESNPHPDGYCRLGEDRCKWCRLQAAIDAAKENA